MEKLPSPEELKMKIIIKARKSSGEDAANNEDDDDDGLEESALGSTYSLAAGTLQNTEDVITMDGTLQLNTARRASTVTSSVESLLHEPNNHSRAFEEETEITQKTNHIINSNLAKVQLCDSSSVEELSNSSQVDGHSSKGRKSTIKNGISIRKGKKPSSGSSSMLNGIDDTVKC